MPTSSEWLSRMRTQLSVTEPNLDTSVGTVTRKILDAVSESLAEASISNYLIDYQYDIDSKQGADLDSFVELFGFTRLPGRRATGLLTLVLSGERSNNFLLPVGAQFSTSNEPAILFATVTPVAILAGETSAEVPVQAIETGARGNVPPYSVRTVRSSLTSGIRAFNEQAFTNGQDPESDAELRLRFRKTVFQKMAGTVDSFVGVALENPDVKHANAIGPRKTRREQIELTDTDNASITHGTSTLEGAKYIYPDSVIFGPSIDGGDIRKEGSDYEFVLNPAGNEASIKSLSGSDQDPARVPDGIYDLEYDYTPAASRNLPQTNVVNRVDLWVSGIAAASASETAVFQQDSLFIDPSGGGGNGGEQGGAIIGEIFSLPTPTPDLNNFVRLDEERPEEDNFFIPLSFGPILTVPETITLIPPSGNDTFTFSQESDNGGSSPTPRFWIVHEDVPFGWGFRSNYGLELENLDPEGTGDPALPPSGSTVQVTYTYNQVPQSVYRNIQDWRLLTTDVMVHQAKMWYLTTNFVAILRQGVSKNEAEYEVGVAVGEYLDGIGFAETIQASDILAAAYTAPSIDAIRWATSEDDAVNYAIQRYVRTSAFTSTLETGDPEKRFATKQPSEKAYFASDDAIKRVTDVFLDDATVPVFNGCRIIVRAENNYGSS